MNNVFKDFKVTEFFDLKGSTQGRNLLKLKDTLSQREVLYGKTAMKDNDFTRFFKNSIVLEENDQEIKDLLCRSHTFGDVM